MFTCTELVTGFDDFGKVIFLQSRCDRGRGSDEGRKCAHCGGLPHKVDGRPRSALRTTDDGIQDILDELLEAPLHRTNVFPLR